MKIGTLEIEKAYIGNQEAEKIFLGTETVLDPDSGAPVSHTYYYQFSGGSKVEMTEVASNQYSTGAISGFSGMLIKFWEDNTPIILTDSDQTNPCILSYGDDYMQITFPVQEIMFIVDDTLSEIVYDATCTRASAYIIIDGVDEELYYSQEAGGGYDYSFPENKPVGTNIQIKTFDTISTISYYDDFGDEQTTTDFTSEVCYDAGQQLTITWDYSNGINNGINVCRVDYLTQGGSECAASSTYYIFINQQNTYVEIDSSSCEFPINLAEHDLRIEDNDEFYIGPDDGSWDDSIEIYFNGSYYANQPYNIEYDTTRYPNGIESVGWCDNIINLTAQEVDPTDPGDDDGGDFEG